MNIINSTIHLQEMTFYAYHGVLPQERIVGAYYSVSLSIDTADISEAIAHDRLESTINYAEVYQVVAEEMKEPSALLEHVAGRILHRLFIEQPLAHRATITVAKQAPPIIGADIQHSAVTLTAER